jgi:hypothetical protein
MRARGGFIGANVTPAIAAANSAASGVWTVREAESLKRAGTWPRAAAVPETISGLQIWLDSSDASTLYNATTGGSLVAADGAVARWEDKSGNGRHATQATSGSRPLRKANQRNSLDAIEFNGTSHFLDFSSELSFTQYTAFAVVKRSSVSGTAGVFCADDGDGTRAAQMIRVNGGAPESISFSETMGGAATASSSLTVSANEWFVATARQTSSALAIYKNATAGASVSATHHSTAVSPTLGRVLKNIADNFLWNGNIGEVIFYNSALSDAGRAAVESYLMTKWGIS